MKKVLTLLNVYKKRKQVMVSFLIRLALKFSYGRNQLNQNYKKEVENMVI